MIRTVLVTLVENKITRERKEIYGRYDPVTLERQNYKVLESFKRQYEMSDDTFARYATKKGDIKL